MINIYLPDSKGNGIKPGSIHLAMATAIWHNWTTGAPVKRSLIAYDR